MMQPRMIQFDRDRTAKDLLQKIDRLFELSAGKIRSIEESWRRERRAGVHDGGTLHGARLDRVDAGVPVRLGAAAVRRDRRRARSSSSAARARSSGWRRTSRTSACTITASTTSAPTASSGGWRARGASTPSDVGSAVLRAGAEGQRRGAGAALDADSRTAASSTRSTARTRCSSTRSDRCARSRSAHVLGPAADGGAGRAGQPARAAACSTRARRRSTTSTTAAAATASTCAGASRTRACSTSPTAPIAARARSRATRRSARGRAAWPGRCSGSPRSSSSWPRAARRRARPMRRPRRRLDARRGARDVRLLHRRGRAPTACRTGTPARPAWRRSATGAIAPADPFNDHEPVDSSAAAIAAQGLLRLGRFLDARAAQRRRAVLAGRACASSTRSSTSGPYLSADAGHQGLLLHSVYHWPNGWDHVPAGAHVPRGESSQWGDYHAREAGALREAARRRPAVPHVLRAAEHMPDREHDGATLRRAETALITGGTRGIGLGIARALARDGGICSSAACAGSGRRGVARRAAAFGAAVDYVAADISQPDGSRARSSTRVRARYGALNALVNNAGRAPRVRADLLDATEDSFEELLRTNLQGPYFLTQAIARDRSTRRADADVPRPRSSSSRRCRRRWRRPTAASTASARPGLSMAARLFAVRLAAARHSGLRGAPGIIATDMTAGRQGAYDRRIADGLVPEGRWGQPDDVGRAVAALVARRRAVRDRQRHPRRRRAVAATTLNR